MLDLVIPSTEIFNEMTQEFGTTKEYKLRLEHSLVSLAKWESKWCTPFLGKKEKTKEQSIDYVRCMTITQNIDPNVYLYLGQKEIDSVAAYIDAPMTATTFSNSKETKTNKEVITAEIIYYWMIAYNIPFECQTWHLNRLLTLVNVCSIKNQPKGKFDKKTALKKQRELNAARRAQLNTTG